MEEESGGEEGQSGGDAFRSPAGPHQGDEKDVFTPKSSLARSPTKNRPMERVSVGSIERESARDESNERGASNGTVEQSGGADGRNLIETNVDTSVTDDRNGSFREVVESCSRNDVQDALSMLMKNAGKVRQRTNSASADPEEEASGKRKSEMSPEKLNKRSKERKINPPTFEEMERMIGTLNKMIQEQVGVRKATKNQSKIVKDYFEKLKISQIVIQAAANQPQKKENDILILRSKMDKASNLEEINSLIAEPWPNGSYRHTKIDPKCGQHKEDALISFIVWPENFAGDRNFQELCEKVPAVQGITEVKLRDMVHIKISFEENVAIPGIESSNRTLNTMIYGAVLSDPNLLETADLIKWADQVKAYAMELKRDRIIISFPDDKHLIRIRKVFECRFAGSDLQVSLKPKDNRKKPQMENAEEALIIGGGNSYAEVLKNLQKEIDPEVCGVRIKRVSKTADGEVRLSIVETKSGGREEMVKRIGECIPSECSLKKVVRTRAIIVTNIGEDVDPEQVKDSLANLTGMSRSDIRLNEFRGSFRGYKSITAILPKDQATKVLDSGSIKIGWYSCKVKERVEPDFCQRCQEYGHPNCKGPQKKKKCLKCGSQEHLAKDCGEVEEYCFTCSAKGHRANSMKCQVFKGLVEAKRRNNAQY